MGIKCYNTDNQELTHLTQWDVNQKIIIKYITLGSTPEVHFSNANSKHALVTEATYSANTLTVEVPNILLQEGLTISLYVYELGTGNSAKTTHIIKIPVIPRAKPDSYTYTDNAYYIAFDDLKSVLDSSVSVIDLASNAAERATKAAEAAEGIKDYVDDALATIQIDTIDPIAIDGAVVENFYNPKTADIVSGKYIETGGKVQINAGYQYFKVRLYSDTEYQINLANTYSIVVFKNDEIGNEVLHSESIGYAKAFKTPKVDEKIVTAYISCLTSQYNNVNGRIIIVKSDETPVGTEEYNISFPWLTIPKEKEEAIDPIVIDGAKVENFYNPDFADVVDGAYIDTSGKKVSNSSYVYYKVKLLTDKTYTTNIGFSAFVFKDDEIGNVVLYCNNNLYNSKTFTIPPMDEKDVVVYFSCGKTQYNSVNGKVVVIVGETAPTGDEEYKISFPWLTDDTVTEGSSNPVSSSAVIDYVDERLEGFEIPEGEPVNLTNYYTKDEIDKKGFITADDIPEGGSGAKEISIFKGLTASFYGDSLTQVNNHYTKGYHEWVKELLGLKSYTNYAVSGYKTSDVYDTVNSISDTANIIFVMCGVNDETFSTPLGTLKDNSTDTIYGSYNVLCKTLKEKYPTKLIVFITPHYQTKYPNGYEGITCYEISKAMKEVCEKYAIPIYDNFILSGIHETNLSYWTTDRCHWNDNAHEMVGRNLSKFIMNTFNYYYGYVEEVEPDIPTPATYTITRKLTNCKSSKSITSVVEGTAHTETFTANSGYTLIGATVSITMGGNNISSAYSNGVLNIPSVTGNIVITVSAAVETIETTLTSISATYNGGDVSVGTELTDLIGDIVVTATYSDGTHNNVIGYELSGEVVEGLNTITVTYQGKTATFTVNGVVAEIPIGTPIIINNSVKNVTFENNTLTMSGNNQTFYGVTFYGTQKMEFTNISDVSTLGWILVGTNTGYKAVGLGQGTGETYDFNPTLKTPSNQQGGFMNNVQIIESLVVELVNGVAHFYLNGEEFYSVEGTTLGFVKSNYKTASFTLVLDDEKD